MLTLTGESDLQEPPPGPCPTSPVLLASQDPELPPLLHNVIPGLRGKRTSGDLARVRLYKSQNQFNFDDSGQL